MISECNGQSLDIFFRQARHYEVLYLPTISKIVKLDWYLICRKLFNKECQWINDETEPSLQQTMEGSQASNSRKRKQKSAAEEYSKIYVKSLNGNKTHTVRIVSCMTVKQLKQLVKTVDGTSVERQHLILAGKELQDQYTLDNYDVKSHCTMHLVCSKTSKMLKNVNLRRLPWEIF